MNVTGKIVYFGEVEEGRSERGDWKRRTIVVETFGDYPRKMALTFSGSSLERLVGLALNDVVTAKFEPESHQASGTGKWFTSLRAFDITREGGR